MSGPDIFISYSREDRDAASHFAESFESEGFSVWWDAVLHSGETFDEVIESELKAAKAVVVLWSPRSVISRWVRAEATLADRRNKLVPVVIEPCDRPIIFELTHTVDLSQWSGDIADRAWRVFMKDLHRHVDKGKDREPAAVERAGAVAAPRNGHAAISPLSQRFSRGPSEARREYFPSRKPEASKFALSRLESTIKRGREGRDHPDEPETTQFYTRPDSIDLSQSDEFHCLEMTVGDRLEKRFVVSPLGLKIGRSAPADIIVADARVSRSHCRVELADDRLRVLDLNSTNGTFVDGHRVDGDAMLAVGSVLQVGDISFKHEVRTRAEVN